MGRRGYYPPLSAVSLEALTYKICKKCEKPFEIGDETYVKVTRRAKSTTVRYHKKCWDKMAY